MSEEFNPVSLIVSEMIDTFLYTRKFKISVSDYFKTYSIKPAQLKSYLNSIHYNHLIQELCDINDHINDPSLGLHLFNSTESLKFKQLLIDIKNYVETFSKQRKVTINYAKDMKIGKIYLKSLKINTIKPNSTMVLIYNPERGNIKVMMNNLNLDGKNMVADKVGTIKLMCPQFQFQQLLDLKVKYSDIESLVDNWKDNAKVPINDKNMIVRVF